jgi:voltage-gated potassium channel
MATIEDRDDQDPTQSLTDRGSHGRPLRREALICVGRSALVIVASSCFYALAPLGERVDRAVAVQLGTWLLLFAAIIVWQLRTVLHSRHPGLRAVEAVTISATLLILIFAAAYFVSARANPANFSEPLSRIDGLYFSVTIFATVGFGDITARTDAARLLATAQMLCDLLLIGFVAKVLVGLVQRRRLQLGVDPSRKAD